MKIRRPLALFIVLAISLTPILSSFSISSAADERSLNLVGSEIPDSHVIQGVPYIGQENNRMCVLASDIMCFQYYGINITPKELLYIDGAAYCSVNHPKLNSHTKPPILFTCWPGSYYAQNDYNFYSSLYGLSVFEWEPENRINDGKCWNEYWSKVKYYISKDIPLETGIDPSVWPIYQKYRNWSTTPLLALLFPAGHTLVIVGYNETNGTVCYHDPMALLYNQPEKAGYAWENLTVFRRAVKRAGGILNSFSYAIGGYEKISDPLPLEMRIEIAHNRNIEKMKGNKSVYYEIGAKNFHNYGIDAIKSLKEEFLLLDKSIPLAFYCFKEIILQRLLDGGDIYHTLWDTSRTNYIMKHNVSQYLMENMNLSPICKYDGELLENESKCWKDVNSFVTELNEIYKTNGLFKSMKLSKPLINNITILLDNIISIEQAIIDGPGSAQ